MEAAVIGPNGFTIRFGGHSSITRHGQCFSGIPGATPRFIPVASMKPPDVAETGMLPRAGTGTRKAVFRGKRHIVPAYQMLDL